MSIVYWRSGKYAPIVQWFRTSLFQGGNGDSTSPGGRVLRKEVDIGLSISLKLILPGSMPERLMGTDCKFVGNMSTLVQIQLGPIIRRFAMKRYNPLVVLQKCSIPIGKKKVNFSDISLLLFIYSIFFFPTNFSTDLDSYQDL